MSEMEKVRGQSKREEGTGSERLEKAGQRGFPIHPTLVRLCTSWYFIEFSNVLVQYV